MTSSRRDTSTRHPVSHDRVVVLGASGLLGHAVVGELTERCWDVSGVARRDLPCVTYCANLADEDELAGILDFERPAVIVNCAGIVPRAPSTVEERRAVNTMLPHWLAAWCERNIARLVHVSTDCVFSGARGDYREGDERDATDEYGKSKVAGEIGTDRVLTIRTSFIGPELGTSRGLLAWYAAHAGQTARGWTRSYWSGLTSQRVASFIADVLERPLDGVYHLAGPRVSKHDLLVALEERFRLGVTIEPDDSVVSDKSLNCERLQRDWGWVVPTWPEMLAEMKCL